MPDLPPKLVAAAMIPRWHRAELVVKALETRDPDMVLQFLLADPRTRSLDHAQGLVDAWFADPRNREVARWFVRV